MHILLTGGTGFIGQALLPQLLAQTDTAVTLLLRDHHKQLSFPPPINTIFADLRDTQTVTQAVQQTNPDTVIHLAAAGVTDPFMPVKDALTHNVSSILNLLQACFEHSSTTQKFIIGRTPGELSAMNVYAASKAAAWQFCRMYAQTQQWPIIGAMIYQAYGPGQQSQNVIPAAIKAAQAHEDFPMTAGSQERDWVYITDVVAGILAVLQADLAPSITVDIGTGQLTSVADVVRKIYTIVDTSGQPQIGVLPSRVGETHKQVADATQTLRLTGWQASISVTQGLNKTCTNFNAKYS